MKHDHPIDEQSVGAIIGDVLRTNPLASGRHKALASIIADLLNKNEPLLKASADGPTVVVSERGGPGVMRFTVGEA